MSFGEDFGLGMRYGALEADAATPDGEHRHFPGARRQRVGWHQDADGKWNSAGEDAHLWEVFCVECGDTDGPIETQSEVVQALRGPYRHEHQAKRIAESHSAEN